MFLTPESLVYDLSMVDRRPILTLTAVQTRRKLTHDQGVGVTFLPDIFYPVTLPGARIATWSTNVAPMKAARAMFEAGIRNIEDIDRISEIRAAQEKERRERDAAKALSDMFATLYDRMSAAGAFKLPFPALTASAIINRQKTTKRTSL